MATVSINLSQSTMNTLYAQQNANGAGELASAIEIFFKAGYAYGSNHPYYSSASAGTSSIRLNFSDSAYTLYSGVVLANPGASTGSAVATGVEEYWPGALRLTFGGQLNLRYTAQASGPLIESQGGTMTAAAIQTLVPSYSAGYDQTLGNVTLSMQGALTTSATSDLSGVITSLTTKADHFLSSGSITANLNVSGNTAAIAKNLGNVSISGTVSGYVDKYVDGSLISVGGMALAVTGDSVLDQRVFANGANFASNDVIDVSLPAVVGKPWLIASGDGDDRVTIKGGGSALSVNAGNGNDSITLGDDGHAVDGGAGIDQLILSHARADYTITKTGAGYSIHAAGGATDSISNVERLVFGDASVALDTDGVAGQAYRIYQAAFNRAPDSEGAGYWINAMDKGASLRDVAEAFAHSAEFAQLYGAAPSNEEIIGRFYSNVLHRAADTDGFNYWVHILDAKLATAGEVLAGFSESAENQAAAAAVIGNGYAYTPYA